MIKLFIPLFIVCIVCFGNLIYAEYEDCIKDCIEHGYHGIRSVANNLHNCKPWTPELRHNNKVSNYCIMYKESRPWCYAGNGWDYCDIPSCSYPMQRCVRFNQKIITDTQISVMWDEPIGSGHIKGYITLLHQNNICIRCHTQTCSTCGGIYEEYNFHRFCGSRSDSQSVTRSTIFDDLEQNTDYVVYIIVITNSIRTERVSRLSFMTLKSKPDAPINVARRTLTKLRTLSFEWDREYNVHRNRKAEYYLATLTKLKSNNKMEQRINSVRVEFNTLDLCTEYCFHIVAVNKFGQSDPSKKLCSYTLALGMSSVTVNDIEKGSSSTRVISWRYEGNNECPIYYRLKYGIKDAIPMNSTETNVNNFVFKGLESNMIYAVLVRAESKIPIYNDFQYGPYSQIKYLYTGIERPVINEYSEYSHYSGSQLNITWTFDRSQIGSIFEFIIRLIDSSNLCLTTVNLICDSCKPYYNRRNLIDGDKTKRQFLLNCLVNNKQTFPNDKLTGEVVFEKDKRLRNFSTEIYAINLVGVHKVQNKFTFYQAEDPLSHYLKFDNIFANMDTAGAEIHISLAADNTDSKIIPSSKTREKITVVCPLGELVSLLIKVESENSIIMIPFNISCGLRDPINIVSNLTYQIVEQFLHIFWNVSDNGGGNYSIYWMGNKQFFHRYVKTNTTSFIVELTHRKKWHQICIATINNKLITSKYICSQYSYSPGPVVNVTGYATSKSIHLSWQKLKEDIHYGYIVNISSIGGACQTVFINMEHYNASIYDHCRNVLVIRWRFLQVLTIPNLTNVTKYNVSIYSINGNNTSLPTSATLTTTKEEVVRDLQVSRNGSNIFIRFVAPTNCEHVTMEYNVKVILHGIMICDYNYKIIFNEIINTTSVIVPTNYSNSCFKYQVEVVPIRDCHTTSNVDQLESNIDVIRPYSTSTLTEDISNITETSDLFKNLDITLLSVNLLKLSWGNTLVMNTCNKYGLMVELVGVANISECMTWIMTRTTCSAIIEKIQRESNCYHREYLEYDDRVVNRSVMLHGRFSTSVYYTVRLWIITDKVRLISMKQIKYEDKTECIHDCFDTQYGGLRSGTVDGRICLRWTELGKRIEHANYRSNTCHFNRTISKVPWCIYQKNGHRVDCDIPKCKVEPNNDKCNRNIETVSSKNSIMIKLPLLLEPVNGARGYIILLHSNDHECQRYIITTCPNCVHLLKLSIQIQSFYMSCRSGSVVNHWVQDIAFDSLKSNKEYFVYIIPLFDHTTTGPITNLTVVTRASDSLIPHSIRVTDRNISSLRFSWISYRKGPATILIDYYNATLVNLRSKTESSIRCSKEVAEFFDLDACTNYCIHLFVVFIDGHTHMVDVFCAFTLSSSPGPIRLYDTRSGSMTNRLVSWSYLGSDHCAKDYRVEISNDFMNKTFSTTTNETYLNVDGLKTDMSYRVRVRTEMYHFDRIGLTLSDYSVAKYFFSGQGLGLIRVDNILSGPSLNRTVSWRYSGNNEDTLNYRIEYHIKNLTEMLYLKTDARSATLDKLQGNMIYNLRVRAETPPNISDGEIIGHYSEIKEFYTGRLNATISNVISHIDSSKKIINVFWTADDITEGSLFEFVVRVNNRTQHCVGSINFICNSYNHIHRRKYVRERSMAQWNKLTECFRSTQKQYRIDDDLLGGAIHSRSGLDNSTLTIYGLNLMGVHKLYELVL